MRIVARGKCRSYKVGSYLSKRLNRLFYLPQYMFLHTFTEASVVFGECWTVRQLEWRDVVMTLKTNWTELVGKHSMIYLTVC